MGVKHQVFLVYITQSTYRTPKVRFFYAIFPTTQSSIADTMFLIIINQLQFWSFRDKNT